MATVHLMQVGESRDAVTRNSARAIDQRLATYDVCVDGSPVGRVRAVIVSSHRKSGRVITGTSQAKRWRVDDGSARPPTYETRYDAVREVLVGKGWSFLTAQDAAKTAAVQRPER